MTQAWAHHSCQRGTRPHPCKHMCSMERTRTGTKSQPELDRGTRATTSPMPLSFLSFLQQRKLGRILPGGAGGYMQCIAHALPEERGKVRAWVGPQRQTISMHLQCTHGEVSPSVRSGGLGGSGWVWATYVHRATQINGSVGQHKYEQEKEMSTYVRARAHDPFLGVTR